MRRILYSLLLVMAVEAVLESCGHDSSLREYLSRNFWLPFARRTVPFERRNVRRASQAFAGMNATNSGNSNLDNLRSAYRQVSTIDPAFCVTNSCDAARPLIDAASQIMTKASSDSGLTTTQKEEVALIAAKIDMRFGELDDDPVMLSQARQKLQTLVRSARNSAFVSEARGWIAHIDWVQGDQAAAGKAYLDELNHDGSNLSRETLLQSLHLVYGYDGGSQLRDHISEYFDTPEHAAFAIQLITNPHSKRSDEDSTADNAAFAKIMRLAEQHRNIFDSAVRSQTLTLLLMRTALRMGDVQAVVRIVEMIPKDSAVRQTPDFNWMEASARFLLRDYQAAATSLRTMFESNESSREDKAGAAYGLVGVYQKLDNGVEQLHYALWLRAQQREPVSAWNSPDGTHVENRTVYWAPSSWDLGTLLEYQLSSDTLRDFIDRYPNAARLRIVRYALAVRLARENRYAESADMYAGIGASVRATRMRELAALFGRTKDQTLTDEQRMEARYRFAEFLSHNPERIYFNDRLWDGFQNHALIADSDERLTKNERDSFFAGERNLRDSQEERWRAYLILNEIVEQTNTPTLGRRAATLALQCLRGITVQRFGRDEEIRKADIRLSNWLRNSHREQ